MSKLAIAIAKNEGFFVSGSLPQRDKNPGDLRHSNHSSHEGEGSNDIGIIDTVADGWADLERQLKIYAARTITLDPETRESCAPRLMNLHDLAFTYAPPADHNPTSAYLNSLCSQLDATPEMTVAEALALG